MIKELFLLKKTNDPYIRHFFSIVCILIVFMIGYFQNQIAFASFGALGISTFNYYKPLPHKHLIKYLFSIGIFMASSNLLGMFASHFRWTAPIIVGIVAFLGRFFFRLYKIEKPGPYFSVMFVSIGVSSNLDFSKIPLMTLFFMIGVLIAVVMALLFSLFDKCPISIYDQQADLKERLVADPSVIIDSYFYSAILFFATYLSFSLKLYNPYWLVVSCAAILQGNNFNDVFSRNIQRIIGTIIGLVIAALMMELHWSTLNQMFVISILYMIVDFFKKKNYTVLLIFSTPMALMLSNLVHHQYISTLIQYRFISIILGSLLGLISAWLITKMWKFYFHNQHFINHLKKNKL
ncbi:FUSC family protein [Enterococcus gilvus]|uniref:FUSC family protein n=1 Tax=Enterococcus gilvus TaxID=160453 RepID=UPI003EDA3ECD